MKKTYQIPETEIVISNLELSFLDGSPGEVGPDDMDSNTGKTFEEEEIPMETSTSLWDD